MPIQEKPDNSTRTVREDKQQDPLPSFAFHVEIAGVEEAAFTSASGISVTRPVTALREGGANNSVFWKHEQLDLGKMTLERGIAYSNTLWNWFNTGAEDGKVELKSVTVRQYVPYTTKVAREYILTGCMPTAWTGPSFNAGSNEVAVERLELAFRTFELRAV